MPSGGEQASRAREDDGSADPALTAALTAAADDPGRLPDVLAALHRSRVLVPVLARSGDGAGPDPLRGAENAEVVLPLLLDDEGERAVPVFSSVASMARWNPSARPVPVPGRQAAAAALGERAEGLVVDLAGPAPATLGLPEVRALAEGRAARPAYDNDVFGREVGRLLAAEPAVAAGWLGPGAGADATVTVLVDAPEAADAVASRLAVRLRASALGPHAVRGLELVVVTSSPAVSVGREVHRRPPP